MIIAKRTRHGDSDRSESGMNKIQETDGFSLLELMIVIAIIAILASIGFPLYRTYSTKAKATEATSELGHIRTMQVSYKSVNDTYLTLKANPPGDVPSSHVPWGNPGANWSELGFFVTRTRYQFGGTFGDTFKISSSFLLTAQSDLRADGAPFDTWTLDNNAVVTHTDQLE